MSIAANSRSRERDTCTSHPRTRFHFAENSVTVGAMPLPKAYLESSVISYLAARESRDPIVAAHQQLTRDWWDRRRREFDLYVSVEVLNEIRRGDPEAARVRLSQVELLPVLETHRQAR